MKPMRRPLILKLRITSCCKLPCTLLRCSMQCAPIAAADSLECQNDANQHYEALLEQKVTQIGEMEQELENTTVELEEKTSRVTDIEQELRGCNASLDIFQQEIRELKIQQKNSNKEQEDGAKVSQLEHQLSSAKAQINSLVEDQVYRHKYIVDWFSCLHTCISCNIWSIGSALSYKSGSAVVQWTF